MALSVVLLDPCTKYKESSLYFVYAEKQTDTQMNKFAARKNRLPRGLFSPYNPVFSLFACLSICVSPQMKVKEIPGSIIV